MHRIYTEPLFVVLRCLSALVPTSSSHIELAHHVAFNANLLLAKQMNLLVFQDRLSLTQMRFRVFVSSKSLLSCVHNMPFLLFLKSHDSEGIVSLQMSEETRVKGAKGMHYTWLHFSGLWLYILSGESVWLPQTHIHIQTRVKRKNRSKSRSDRVCYSETRSFLSCFLQTTDCRPFFTLEQNDQIQSTIAREYCFCHVLWDEHLPLCDPFKLAQLRELV